MTLEPGRDVSSIEPPRLGSARRDPSALTGTVFLDAAQQPVVAVDLFLRNIFAAGSSANSTYAYAVDLLRWWRFLATPQVNVSWNRATRQEFDDFILWMKVATPRHGGDWRHGTAPRVAVKAGFAPRTINHNIATLASFYRFHEEHGDGPISPVPAQGRIHAHHNPMQQFIHTHRGPGRQKVPEEAPKSLSDSQVADLLNTIKQDRDRALVEFFLSSGARASELLGLTGECVDEGRQRIFVTRKGGATQWLPASPESFLYLVNYLKGRELREGEPVWLTLRAPYTPLRYPALRAVLLRLETQLGVRHRLHQFRHTAAYDMMSDPDMNPRDVQEILGHAWLTSTQIYTRATEEEVLLRAAAHYRRERPKIAPVAAAAGYNRTSLENIFGGSLER
ncbi:tyrosine-type recombinase/integrase [Curtobacterium sp. RIT-PI-V]|uniref:tyrosine-type recombinase/integrase n=1 Tax=Curtobacterium sp. RIT-PI-V TaxID=3035296 RepID=UPI0021D793DB|nr:tyrosine-type recombinase/integrase [Curtobacterium sp. RIT-PI-V]